MICKGFQVIYENIFIHLQKNKEAIASLSSYRFSLILEALADNVRM